MRAEFTETARDGEARCGLVSTPRGSFETPVFMPVGTRGAVRHLSSSDLEQLGAEVVLANTYHLMLRPGTATVAAIGGMHGFAGWDGHVLTDSGGYQIYSLDPRIDDHGARFKSVYDGSEVLLTPESAAEIQALLGADIQMALDVCCDSTAEREVLESAVRRTSLWAERGRRAFLAHGDAADRQCQFGIVQGGTDAALRALSARQVVEIGFDGYAVGGLSVGEDRTQMLEGVDACIGLLPADRPRYFMGLGDPVGITEAVARGIDMFDCVMPTRLARHGTVLTDSGRYNLSRAEFAADDTPLDADWPQSPAARWPKAYLRHLLLSGEPTAARIITLHNLAWLLRFMQRTATAIREARFSEFRKGVHEVWSER